MSYFSLGDENEDDGGSFDNSAQIPKPNGGGLGSLFGLNDRLHDTPATNQSLQYKPPKPPKPDGGVDSEKTKANTKTSTTAKQGSSVLMAVAVNAFKLLNGQYESQGKLGMALLANHDAKDYKILMYVTKQQPVTTASINEGFNINPLAGGNNYATFNDDARQPWSVAFDAKENLTKFLKQICLCKFFCNTSVAVSQDISPGEESQRLATGDSLEVKYTGWLVEEFALGKVFDSNHNNDKTFRFKAGKGKVIKGWDEGVVGMMKKGSRFIVIPPSLAYGAKYVGNKVPSNSTLAFQVDILRIKYVNEVPTSLPQSTPFQEATPQQVGETPQPTRDTTVKNRAASLTEHNVQQHDDGGKAKLMSRMAKMGHAMLPQPSIASNPPTTTQQQPDSSQTMHQALTSSVQPANVPPPSLTPRQSPASVQGMPLSSSPVPYMTTQHTDQQMYSSHMIVQPSMQQQLLYQTPITAYAPQQQFGSGLGDIAPTLLSESKEQKIELKDINKKLDKISDKMDQIQKSSEPAMPAYAMDATMIAHSIQRILKESENLKSQMDAKDKHIEHQNNKMSELMTQNQRYMEKSHQMMEQNHDTFKQTLGRNEEKHLHLEQEKLQLTQKLSAAMSEINELKETINNQQKLEQDLRKRLHEVEDNVKQQTAVNLESKDLMKKLSEEEDKSSMVQKKVKVLEEQQSSWRKEKSDLQSTITKLQKENEELRQKTMTMEENKHEQTNMQKQIDEIKKQSQDAIAIKEKEGNELSAKLETLQNKFIQLREVYVKTKENENELTEKIEELEQYQEKYEHLRGQATSMKQKYEGRIRQLMSDQNKFSPTNEETSQDNVSDKVKKIMNSMFLHLREEFVKDEEYTGSQALNLVLAQIKATTLSLIEEERDCDKNDIEKKDSQTFDSDEAEAVEETVDAKNEEDNKNQSEAKILDSDELLKQEPLPDQQTAQASQENVKPDEETNEDKVSLDDQTQITEEPPEVNQVSDLLTVEKVDIDSNNKTQDENQSLRSSGNNSPDMMETPPPLVDEDSEEEPDWLK